jgi:hypothetical protein
MPWQWLAKWVVWFVYFRDLSLIIFCLCFAYSNFTNRLFEGRVDSSVLFYTDTKFHRPCQSHVICWGIFALQLPHWKKGKDAALTWLTYVHTSNCRFHFQWYVYGRAYYCHLSTKIYFICKSCVLKNLLKWRTFTRSSIHPPISTQPGFSGTNDNQTSHGMSPPLKLSNSRSLTL